MYSSTLSSPISGEKHLFALKTTPSLKLPERSILSFVLCFFMLEIFCFLCELLFLSFSRKVLLLINLSLRSLSLSALVLKSIAL